VARRRCRSSRAAGRLLAGDAPVAVTTRGRTLKAVTDIFSDPTAQGYRLVRSGTTVSFGAAPGGIVGTAPSDTCPKPSVPPPTMSSYSYVSAPGDFTSTNFVSRRFRSSTATRCAIGPVTDPQYGQTLHLGTYETNAA
jgi:hypothetical protein